MNFDFLFRTATSVYGQSELVGASWDLFPWFVGAAVVFVVLDILRLLALVRRGGAGGAAGRAPAAAPCWAVDLCCFGDRSAGPSERGRDEHAVAIAVPRQKVTCSQLAVKCGRVEGGVSGL